MQISKLSYQILFLRMYDRFLTCNDCNILLWKCREEMLFFLDFVIVYDLMGKIETNIS